MFSSNQTSFRTERNIYYYLNPAVKVFAIYYLISCSFFHSLQLSIFIIISHGSGKLLVIHTGVVLPFAPQPGNSFVSFSCFNAVHSFYLLGVLGGISDIEDSFLFLFPGDHAGIVLGVAE